MYNPVYYYRVLAQMQNSPWTWLSPELSQQIRESRRELVAGLTAAALTAGAYAYGGPAAAARTYDFTRSAFRLEHKAPARNGTTPRRRTRTTRAIGPNSSTEHLLQLECGPEEVD